MKAENLHTKQNLIMRRCIQKVATGPEYSKDLDYEEAYAAMTEIIKGNSDPIQSAVFLIALRMKRETDAENKGTLRAILDYVDFHQADADQIVDISDPYDGFNRGLLISPFLPALLASTGVSAFSHGLDKVGPKYGTTHPKVLRAAGVETNLSTEKAVKQLNKIGWTYVDQKNFCPKLHQLIDLRTRLIKRPLLTTVEVLAGPIKGKKSTHLITGYVHKAYPPIYLNLARFADFDSSAVINGCEGGIIPSLQHPSKLYEYKEGTEDTRREIDPTKLGIKQNCRSVPIPENASLNKVAGDEIATKFDADELAQYAAEKGVEALQGGLGPARDSLLYGGAIILTHLDKVESMQEAYSILSKQLDNGLAYDHFQQAVAC